MNTSKKNKKQLYLHKSFVDTECQQTPKQSNQFCNMIAFGLKCFTSTLKNKTSYAINTYNSEICMAAHKHHVKSQTCGKSIARTQSP